MVVYNVQKSTDGLDQARVGFVLNSTVLISNDTAFFSDEYENQNGMGLWEQVVPSVAIGSTLAAQVGIKFTNAGAKARLVGAMSKATSDLLLKDFLFTKLDGSPSPISFVARVYDGVNSSAPLISTLPGSLIVDDGLLITGLSGTAFCIEVEALAANVFMQRTNVRERTVDMLASFSDPIPVAPAGTTRTWEAAHSLDNALLPATSGTGAIAWSAFSLPAGEAVAISIHDTMANTGTYTNSAHLTGGAGNTGTWNASGQTVTILAALQDLVDCNGAWDIQARQAFLRGKLKAVPINAYAVFKLYNTGGSEVIWESAHIPGDTTNPQNIEVVVPYGAQVLQPGLAYDFEIEVFDPTLVLISNTERCYERCAPFTTLTDDAFHYLQCGGSWDGHTARHALMPQNVRPIVKNDSDGNALNRIGPADGTGDLSSGPFFVTHEYFDGYEWVLATKRTESNSYGTPAATVNPEQINLNYVPYQFAYTNLPGDGIAYPWRMTLRNAQNTILEQVQCDVLATASVPPLQCPSHITNVTDTGATFTIGPIDRSYYSFAEKDQIKVQLRKTGTNTWFDGGSTTLPIGDGTNRLLDVFNMNITGMEPGTGYDTRIVYITDPGFAPAGYTSAGCNQTFTTTGTAPIAPSADANSATAIGLTNATIHGTAHSDIGYFTHLEWSLAPSGSTWTPLAEIPTLQGDTPLSATLTLNPAEQFCWRTVITNDDGDVIVTSEVICSATRAPNAYVEPTSGDINCPNIGEDPAPFAITATHTFTHSGGADAITADVSISAVPAPAGTVLTNWTATKVGTVTGSALSGTGNVAETITLSPASSITYTANYAVPTAGGLFRSLARFNGPGIDQKWTTAVVCDLSTTPQPRDDHGVPLTFWSNCQAGDEIILED